MTTQHPDYRGSIRMEEARVVAQRAWPSDQFVLTLEAPAIAATAMPGSFVHLTCDPHLPMRRPLSLQRTNPRAGTVEILYKVVGEGTQRLSTAAPGDVLSCMGPIGKGFSLWPERQRALLIGGGVGLPPMVFFAERLAHRADVQTLALLGSEIPFPFNAVESRLDVQGIAEDVRNAHPELEAAGVASRLSSGAGFPGCYRGHVTELAGQWLGSLSADALATTALYACGPTPMLRAVARIAAQFRVPAQVSLEEYMACAVGGCAGCTVPVTTTEGVYMKRVCVDGPVFEAQQVFPEFY